MNEHIDPPESLDVNLSFDGAATNLGRSRQWLTDLMEELSWIMLDGDGAAIALPFALKVNKYLIPGKGEIKITQEGLKELRKRSGK